MNKQIKFIFVSLLARGEGVGGRLSLLLACLLLASCTEVGGLMDRSESTVNFSLSSDAVVPEVSPTRAGAVDMEVGTTVRVLAYRRPAGAGSAVLSSANYVGEATYQVTSGSTLALCGVKLDANGTPSVDAGVTAEPLRLIAGTYDFYAVTPALAVDHTGSEPTLNVRHHTDYAVSVTEKTISPGNSTVGLTTLDRRCTLLSFSTDRKEGATDITQVVMGNVLLTNMGDEPIQAKGTGLLDVATNTYAHTFTLAAAKFGIPDEELPYKAYAEEPCLPKSAGKFDLNVNVKLGSATNAVQLEAKDLSMTFDPCKHYAFTLRFKSNGIELAVGVAKWTDAIGSTQVGGAKFPVEVVVGEWTDVDWSTGIGGNKIPPFTPNVENWGDLNNKLNIGANN